MQTSFSIPLGLIPLQSILSSKSEQKIALCRRGTQETEKLCDSAPEASSAEKQTQQQRVTEYSESMHVSICSLEHRKESECLLVVEFV